MFHELHPLLTSRQELAALVPSLAKKTYRLSLN